MRQGKLSNQELEQIVLSALSASKRPDTLQRSAVGADCAVISFEGELCVLSTDPITAADEDAGRLSILVSANDVAASGATPVAALLTVLAPPGTSLEALHHVVRQAAEEAALRGIEIVGGHTELTDAVTRLVLSVTVVGSASKNQIIAPDGAQPGDALVMTKHAALEGTLILARSKRKKLLQAGLAPDQLTQAYGLTSCLSVEKEARIAAKNGAHAMHDVTEGGILGAAWEMAEAAGLGLQIHGDAIPLLPVTQKIADILELDPLRLIGSGALLIAHPDGAHLCQLLQKSGIYSNCIGYFHQTEQRIVTMGEKASTLLPPISDEIYHAFD